jgi:hypothetical protein
MEAVQEFLGDEVPWDVRRFDSGLELIDGLLGLLALHFESGIERFQILFDVLLDFQIGFCDGTLVMFLLLLIKDA